MHSKYKFYGSVNLENSLCSAFIVEKFTSHNMNRDRSIYPYRTTAPDIDLVKNVMDSVMNYHFKTFALGRNNLPWS